MADMNQRDSCPRHTGNWIFFWEMTSCLSPYSALSLVRWWIHALRQSMELLMKLTYFPRGGDSLTVFSAMLGSTANTCALCDGLMGCFFGQVQASAFMDKHGCHTHRSAPLPPLQLLQLLQLPQLPQLPPQLPPLPPLLCAMTGAVVVDVLAQFIDGGGRCCVAAATSSSCRS